MVLGPAYINSLLSWDTMVVTTQAFANSTRSLALQLRSANQRWSLKRAGTFKIYLAGDLTNHLSGTASKKTVGSTGSHGCHGKLPVSPLRSKTRCERRFLLGPLWWPLHRDTEEGNQCIFRLSYILCYMFHSRSLCYESIRLSVYFFFILVVLFCSAQLRRQRG